MSKIDRHEPGTISWVDLMTPDLSIAREFYGDLLGWSFIGGDDPRTAFYTQCQIEGRIVVGMGKLEPGMSMPSQWGIYFDAEDADRAAASIREHGGQVISGPMDVMEFGRMVVASDPTGACFGVWQAKSHSGALTVREPGAMCWHEVNTRDAVKAAGFYAAVFGLTARRIEAGSIEYHALQKGDKTVAGVLQMDASWPAEIPPHWMTYFQVEDTDAIAAKAGSLGGKVAVEPCDEPYGRFAVISDPAGAYFSVIVPSARARQATGS